MSSRRSINMHVVQNEQTSLNKKSPPSRKTRDEFDGTILILPETFVVAVEFEEVLVDPALFQVTTFEQCSKALSSRSGRRVFGIELTMLANRSCRFWQYVHRFEHDADAESREHFTSAS